MLAAATIALLAAQLASTPDGAKLPASFRQAQLEACQPTTLAMAVGCLHDAFSSEDLAIVRDRIPARRFRPSLDCAVAAAWRLEDPTSPMAQLMRRTLGLHNPSVAAGLLISEFQTRETGGDGLPFDEIREAFRADPPDDVDDFAKMCAELNESPVSEK